MQVAATVGKQEEGAVVQHDGGCAPPLLRARLEGEGARKLERRPLQAVEQTRLLSPRQRDETVVVERNALPLASQNHASLTKYRARKRFPRIHLLPPHVVDLDTRAVVQSAALNQVPRLGIPEETLSSRYLRQPLLRKTGAVVEIHSLDYIAVLPCLFRVNAMDLGFLLLCFDTPLMGQHRIGRRDFKLSGDRFFGSRRHRHGKKAQLQQQKRCELKQQTAHLQFCFFLFIALRRHVLPSKLHDRVDVRVDIGRDARIRRHSLLEPEGGDIGIRVVLRLRFNQYKSTDNEIDELVSVNVGEDDSVQTLARRVVLRITERERTPRK